MKKMFLVLMLLISGFSHSFMGVGTMKCSKILADLDGGPPNDAQLRFMVINWSQGFIAGLNFYGVDQNKFWGPDHNDIFYSIKKECSDAPTVILGEAVFDMWSNNAEDVKN